jgi:transcriptional regulator with XRE-family HTH domain
MPRKPLKSVGLSKTLRDNLAAYDIGATIRDLRHQKKLGLVELGAHTGLSAPMLSKIERGASVPTLPTLMRIALVFGVGLEYFFNDARRRSGPTIVRKERRIRLPERAGRGPVSFHFESLDYLAVERELDAYLAEFAELPAGKSRAHQHAGAEFLYVISGRLGVTCDGREETLRAGDAMYLDGTRPHAYRRIGRARCQAVVVIVPQRGTGTRP